MMWGLVPFYERGRARQRMMPNATVEKTASTEAVVRNSYLNMAQHTREEALESWDIVPSRKDGEE